MIQYGMDFVENFDEEQYETFFSGELVIAGVRCGFRWNAEITSWRTLIQSIHSRNKRYQIHVNRQPRRNTCQLICKKPKNFGKMLTRVCSLLNDVPFA
jgi:hypothetical protein